MKIFKNNSNNNFEHQKKFPRTKKTDFLYKILLASKANEQGSGLVFAFAVGFLLLILGTATIVTSGQNKTNAVVNEKAVQAQAVTDIGTARIKAFLSGNPIYAEYNKDFWDDVPAQGKVSEGTYTSSTGGTCSAITGISSSNSSNSSSLVDSVTGKKAVNSSDTTKGAFLISGYELYDLSNNKIDKPNASEYATKVDKLKEDVETGQTFATGKIEIKGAISPDATDAASNFTAVNKSQSQLYVQVPLIKRDPSNIPFPGVWLSNQSIGSDTQNIDADLMVNASSCENVDLTLEPNRTVIISNATFPSLPDMPTDPDINDNEDGIFTMGDLDKVNMDLPRTNDKADNGIYHYLVDSITGNGTINIKLTTGAKVYIYLQEKYDKTSITYDCDGTCKVSDFRLYGYSDSASTATMCLNGNDEFKGFILAPSYTVGINGGSDLNFQGSLWAKSWTEAKTGGCGSNNGKIVVTQMINSWNDIGLYPENLPAQVGAVSSRERQAVDTIN